MLTSHVHLSKLRTPRPKSEDTTTAAARKKKFVLLTVAANSVISYSLPTTGYFLHFTKTSLNQKCLFFQQKRKKHSTLEDIVVSDVEKKSSRDTRRISGIYFHLAHGWCHQASYLTIQKSPMHMFSRIILLLGGSTKKYY